MADEEVATPTLAVGTAVGVAHAGDDYELALALTLLATARMQEPEVGIAILEESVRVARDAGILSALSIGLPFLAGKHIIGHTGSISGSTGNQKKENQTILSRHRT